MAFEKGHPKFGGRTKGSTVMAKLVATQAKIEERWPGFDPLEKLIEIGMDAIHPILGDPALARDCFKEVAKYFYPQLKQVDVDMGVAGTGPNGEIEVNQELRLVFVRKGESQQKTGEALPPVTKSSPTPDSEA